MFIWIFVHLRNPINVRQFELLTICLYSDGSEDRFVVVQHFWCRKICQIVCRVSRKWMESKFLDQDVDVVSLASKGIVIGCFFGRNYDKILMETEKLTDKIRVTKNGLWSGVDRIFQSSDSAFSHFTNRLHPFGKSVEFDILFLGNCLAYASHASMIISKVWCHEMIQVPWIWAFETVLFLWKYNIFDGRNVILKVGQCWLFYTCCTCATCTAMYFVPIWRNSAIGSGLAVRVQFSGKYKIRIG